MQYDFDDLADRSIDNARKWDPGIVHHKFPHVRADFIPLWIADMDFKAAPEIRSALAQMAQNGAYGYTYPTQRWLDSVVAWQKNRHNVIVDPQWITLGYGTVPNMHYLMQTMMRPGDQVAMFTPVYGPFAYAAQHNDFGVIAIPLRIEGTRYALDLNRLEDEFKKHHPKMLMFCSPHNPSGRIWSEQELIAVADLCLRYNVLLVSDEVHSEHIMTGHFYPALNLPEKYLNNLVMFTSPNKAFNLGGLKLSYSIIPNAAIRERLRHQYVRNSITSPNVPGQIAMTVAYESGADWLDQSEAYIRENLMITQDTIAEHFPGWTLFDMDASYLPWVDVSQSGHSMHEIAEMMADRAGVVVGIGDDYVANADTFIRLNLGTSHAVIEDAMNRMASVWHDVQTKQTV
ncbi:MAG: aminotransferase class I/II-fold pyridoxal phosphate-dependent enzyme [Schleiferilactobacillus harbinensis]|jgi:cystathionine beta-lyase|nr:aminotransferase class I/II-fold pyridoxal phosphate-dependent enzyme [Schleiferilactobacillus harbinensis]MCI1911468.1 aminotransferase class I/II-fold pyridoxal phosphate-dependent enzyme [Schleiferilactobacillus harbinensis]